MTTPAQEVETYKTQRHRCPHCRRSFANRTYAVKHIGWCQKRQANHGCKTCAYFQDEEPESMDRVYPGCPESCGEGEDLSTGLRTHCLKWEAIF